MILVKPSHKILNVKASLQLIELAGRTCYKSENKITEDSAKEFTEMVIKRGHHSVIEHSSLTVKFICDRGVTHELVRHRLCAFSQESTRYCNYKGGVTFVIPPWVEVTPCEIRTITGIGEYRPEKIRDFWGGLSGTVNLSDLGTELWLYAMADTEVKYISLLVDGWSPQQARSVLPNSLKTEIVVTANIREWRHIFTLRCSKAAHPQIREIMIPLHKELKALIPIVFDGINY